VPPSSWLRGRRSSRRNGLEHFLAHFYRNARSVIVDGDGQIAVDRGGPVIEMVLACRARVGDEVCRGKRLNEAGFTITTGRP